MTGEVEKRSQALLTAEHLARLGRLVSRTHEQLKARRPDLAGTLVAGVLAQGAAAHYLHPEAGVGVKDLDLWLFYAQRDGVGKCRNADGLWSWTSARQRWAGTRTTRRTTWAGASTSSPARSPPRQEPTRPTRSAPGCTARRTRPGCCGRRPWCCCGRGPAAASSSGPAGSAHALAEPPAPAPAAASATDGLGPLLERLQTTPLPLSAGERLPTAGGVPSGPGLYAWWAAPRSLPEVAGPAHPARQGFELLDVGIARDLRKRVLADHAHGGTGQSTLRRALASLLTDQESYRTRRTSRTVLVAEDEQRLSGWIRDHLQLTWAEQPSPEDVEGEVIDTLAPPLNQAGNRAHPLYAVVRDARARWRRSAG